ncbi:MAG: hypothetical protein WA151_01465 [Desulfatirhabdiaceae bacterium]
MKQTSLLLRLHKLLPAEDTDVLYPCIQDLLENGLDASRFVEAEQRPNRQEVTQYIAAWCRSIGMGEDDCRGWIIDYCTIKLSSISNSTAAAIRHSTKSNLKYIYRSEVPFSCEVDKNRFKAACSKTCPCYADMSVRFEAEKNRKVEALRVLATCTTPEPDPEPTPKEIRRQAFEKSLSYIRTEVKKGRPLKQIVQLLNKNGYKTRGAKEWTISILSNEISRLRVVDPSKDNK